MKYRKRGVSLSKKSYKRRTDASLCHLMSICGYSEHDVESMENDASMFQEVNQLLTSVKSLLVKKTMLTESVANEVSDASDGSIVEQSQESLTAQAVGQLIASEDDPTKDKNRRVCESILVSKIARDSYNEVVKTINKASDMGLKTYHQLRKNLPVVKCFKCTYDENNPQFLSGYDEVEDDMATNNLLEEENQRDNGIDSVQEVVCDGAIVPIQDCVDLILNRIKQIVSDVPGGTMEKALDGCFLVLCADGAVHSRLKQGDQNIITYSVTLSSRYLIEECYMLPSSGRNILPHVQLKAKENTKTIQSVLKERMTQIVNVKTNTPGLADCYIYDLADGKALYIILGHTHWSSARKPFLLCGCERGQSIGGSHRCHMHTDEEYIKLVQNSVEQWARRDELTEERREWGNDTPYDFKAHKEWCKDENSGASHFGSVPLDYSISQIRFDVMHGRGGVVKVVLKYLRNFFDGTPLAVNKFAAFLKKLPSWDGFVIDPWVTNDAMSHIKGRHAKSFIRYIPECVKVLRTISSSREISHFCMSLSAFSKMCTILGFVIIDDYDDALKMLPSDSEIVETSTKKDIAEAIISAYENAARTFYEEGVHSFLTRQTPGDKETFYSHTLFHYMPSIMRTTYERHGLGVGIFTMEGFEYKNFSSKQVVNNRTNGRAQLNITAQSLRVLQLQFDCDVHDVEKEKKRRSQRTKSEKKRKAVDTAIFEDIDNTITTSTVGGNDDAVEATTAHLELV